MIISGGQSGVDRAALDVARKYGIECGGWCPSGRKAEDGRINDRYPLKETENEDYKTRTRLNVQDSDATLVLFQDQPDKGTRLTMGMAEKYGKPFLIVDLSGDKRNNLKRILLWLQNHQLEVLNVAGPRESASPGVYLTAYGFLEDLIKT